MTLLQQQFQPLDNWLKTHQALWQFDTFTQLENPWRDHYPALAHFLEQTLVDDLSSEGFYGEVFRLCPDLKTAHNFSKLSLLEKSPQRTLTNHLPSYLSTGIKGRKWLQIQAFVAHTPKANHYVEWCAGKGHLGKLLAFQNGKPVHSLEWQKTLCEQGRTQAERLNLPQHFHHADVLKNQGQNALANTECVVALHACGDLHTTLIQQAISAKTKQVCLSPCCYHLTQHEHYQALSEMGKQSTLALRKADLKLAVKEVATAGVREQRLKQQELVYRLGFDAWQRAARQQDQYLPVPSIQKALLKQGFHGFCQWAAAQKHLTEQANNISFDGFEQIGEQRAQQIHKLEAISQLFRPALEYWLVLDRAMHLEEHSYHVEIGKFCEKNLSPRNWMIRAVL